ncbi:MAG: PACE efflux transporter [Desulfobacteraceae bacterium]|nr:PACE efflux transporter [Desulfobacteraceae bacterium]
MRSFRGRVMHTLLFELVLLGICTPVIALVFNRSFSHTGMLSIGMSATAMVCNGLYNYGFDRALIYLKHPLYPRSFRLRCFHSVLFEILLMVFTLPMIMLWMEVSFIHALTLDISFAVFVPVYALGFNWIYDLMIPAPCVQEQ